MAQKHMLPIGEEYFSSIRRGDFYYVDKTGMLSEFFRSRGFVTLFTRPRRFGKSLNMDMFKCFLEIGTDPSLFEGLSVMEDGDVVDAHLGRYPVIALSLKDVDGSTYKKALDGFSSVLSVEARRHEYLLGSGRLSIHDAGVLQNLFLPDLSEKVQRDSLRVLSEMLYKHHGKKTVVLIDEYDVPLDKAWQNGYYREMVEHIRAMFGRALKTNPFVEFTVLTGCLRIARESIFTGINNFFVNSVSDAAFADSFGFTDSEVRDLLDYYNLTEKYDSFREWYDGYSIGGRQMYCPWDVVCQSWKFRKDPAAPMEPYWANSSSNYIVKDLLSNPTEAVKADVEKLISGEAVTKTILPELTYADLADKSRKTRQDFVWSVLYATGYLTDANGEQQESQEKLRARASRKDPVLARTRRLVIPNREVRDIFETQIRAWFERNVNSRQAEWEALCKALTDGDAAGVQELLNSFLNRSISIRDTAVRKEYKESFYHGLLLGLLGTNEDWGVQSNAESGLGFLDIEVLDYARRTGCAIEVKYAEGGSFDAACREAMRQIDDNGYTADLRREDMETIHKYGIAFYKKSCRVLYEKERAAPARA